MDECRKLSVSAAALAALILTSRAEAQPAFQLEVAAPLEARGEAGQFVDLGFEVLLTSAGISTQDGVEGWSIALASTESTVTSATTAGTAGGLVNEGGLRREDGFQNIQFTTGPGNTGVVAAVVLSAGTEVTLPPAGTSSVLRGSVRAVVPQPVVSGGRFQCDPLLVKVGLVDGLQGSGRPVKNKVSYRGLDYRPTLGSTAISVCPRLDQPTFELSIDQPPSLEGEAGDQASFEARVVLNTLESPLGDGAEGWSVGIAAENGRIVSATTAGTAGALASAGGFRQGDGFERTELTTGAGNEGAISAVTLSTSSGTTLPPSGPRRLLRMVIESPVPQPSVSAGRFSCEPRIARLVLRDGLRGSGQPVKNRVSYRGLGLAPSTRGGTTSICPRIREPRYSLGFAGPGSVSGVPGEGAEYEVICRLTSSANDGSMGAEGWSVGVAASGVSVLGATLAGTAGALLSDGGLRKADGFQRTELTAGAGNAGVVSAVVLSTQEGATLPPAGTVDILRITVAGIVPDPVVGSGGDEICVPLQGQLQYVDGLRGSGQPVKNRVSFQGLQYAPPLGVTGTSIVTNICPPIANPLHLEADVLSPNAVEEPDQGQLASRKVLVPAAAPSLDLTVQVSLVSSFEGRDDGARGWAFSLIADAGFGISGATTTGTVVDEFAGGGFSRTEVVDPARNEGRRGVVTGVVLSLGEPRWLPPTGTAPILRLSGRIDTSGLAAPGDATNPVGFLIPSALERGLRGTGTRVDTLVTVFNPNTRLNESRAPVVRGLLVRAEATAGSRFVRGNANRDSKLDISDPVWVLDFLFRGTVPVIDCLDAADANNDGKVDISDPIYTLGFLFLGTASPPAPFPDCGLDPEGDDDLVTCLQANEGC